MSDPTRLLNDLAIAYLACPFCDAVERDRCMVRGSWKTGYPVDRKEPHRQRVEPLWQAWNAGRLSATRGETA